jgi:hypothetical protein
MKDIKGFEGLYAVTSCGKIWSYKSGKFLTPGKATGGYLNVDLCKDGKRKTFLIHRLVAEAYLRNPDNLPQINHKDENKENNCWRNLEWCDEDYNVNFGTRNKRVSKKLSKPIICVETGERFYGISECARQMNLYATSICKVLKGKIKQTGGYTFEYAEDD